MVKLNKKVTFFTVKEIEGSLLICESVLGIGFGELVKIVTHLSLYLSGYYFFTALFHA